MAAASTLSYVEDKTLKGGSQYGGVDPEDDTASTTFTIRTGMSSGYRTDGALASRLSRHSIKLKTSSSFPNLLNLYQQPITEETTPEKKPRRKKSRSRQRTRQKEETLDEDDAYEKRNSREYRMIRMEAVAREQLDRFDNYVNTMKAKVDRQRDERRRYNEALQERLREQEEMEREKLRIHRGPRHTYVHDRKYLKELPESKFCKMTRMADQLKKRGLLKTQGEIEKFWSGYGGRNRYRVSDIFSPTAKTSVQYPNQWITMKKPTIRIESDSDDDDEGLTEAKNLPTQLPPLNRKKMHRKKKKPES